MRDRDLGRSKESTRIRVWMHYLLPRRGKVVSLRNGVGFGERGGRHGSETNETTGRRTKRGDERTSQQDLHRFEQPIALNLLPAPNVNFKFPKGP